MNKQELRRAIRERKRAMSEEEIFRRSEALARKLAACELYRTASAIYGYLSYNQEVRTAPILCRAMAEGKRVAVPKVLGDEMKFIWLDDLNRVAKGYVGIPEPIANGPVADDETALVLMPGLAFDIKGNRVGYGGGFYDKFLALHPHHPTVALCYDFQIVNSLEAQEFDIPVDLVIWE